VGEREGAGGDLADTGAEAVAAAAIVGAWVEAGAAAPVAADGGHPFGLGGGEGGDGLAGVVVDLDPAAAAIAPTERALCHPFASTAKPPHRT
jgi:hypothetical protein